MMDLPLATMTASSARPAGAPSGGHREDPDGFAAALTSLLGDAGHEVVDMVEALETLADLQGAERAELAGVGWPLPAFLALTEEQAAGDTGELGDQTAAEVDALLGQLLDTVEGVVEEAHGDGSVALGELLVPEEGAAGDPGASEGASGDPAAADGADGGAAGQTGGASDGSGDTAAPAGREEVEQALAAAVAANQAAGTSSAGDGDAAGEQDAAGRARGLVTAGATTPETGDRTAARSAESGRTTAAGESRVPGSAPTTVTADAAGTEAAAEPSATLSGMEASRRATADRNVGLPTAIQRIMEAVERLEHQPPPRQLTLELGEIRLRVSMEDGHVRLSLLDGDGEAGDELLRDAEQELAQRGFDLGDDAGSSPDHDTWPGEHAGPARRQPGGTRRAAAHDPAGALRL